MARIDPLSPDVLDDDQRALYDAIVSGPRAGSGLVDDRGALRGPFDPLLRSPAIGQAVQELGAVIRYRGSLPDDLRELAILLAAAEWRCSFELSVHGRIARSIGVDADLVTALRAGNAAVPPPGTPQRLVADVARELFDTRRISDRTYADAAAELGEANTIELLVVLGYYSLLGMILEAFEITP
jgi:4-carboxymuconolactone decarboxylase